MKDKWNICWGRIKNAPKSWKLLGLLLLCVIMLGVVVTVVRNSRTDEEVTYRETLVEYGSLVVGIEESGSVDIGTISQTFDLDMSALQRVETSNSGSGISSGFGNGGTSGGMGGMSGGGMTGGNGGADMFGQMFNMNGSSNVTTSGETSELKIAEVHVSIGEQVEGGDVLYTLVEEGVAELTEELKSNVNKAKADLDALIADQELSKATAENTYQTSLAYGSFAAAEKNSTIAGLEQAVAEKQEELETARANVTIYEAKLEQAEYDLGLAKEVLDNSTWAREHAAKEDIFSVSSAYQQAEEAQTTYDTLKQEKEQAEQNLEQAKKNVQSCETAWAKAKRELATGTLSAEETYQLRMLAYENAQETYDITLAYLEDNLKAQEEIYAEAEEKWEEFASHISGNQILAKYSGVITSVDLAAGDSLTTGASIVTLYDMEEVSMTVTLEEEDMTHIEVGGMANISFTAYSEDIYKAEVTEISDASSENSGTITYEVTVTLQGDVSNLFQGMTGDITFVTKEMEEVMYVSNRAIIREGTKSYVKVKDAVGNVKKTQVVTGFSDGIYVEIVEGLAVGDVVLIESRVNNE